MIDYKRLSAVEITKKIKHGDFTAQEITQEALNLVQTIGHDLNAFISICEDKALLQAETIDKKIKNDGSDNLSLAGVPIAIKDNICYRDYPTTCGSHILENFIPPYNATCVDKLINAGAIIIGKTNMDEFAMGSSSENSYFGAVKNPWGNNLVPGGSSGGSASAVAAGIVPIAFGSDTGGSIRQPASFCGVYGFKPTYGGISRYGLIAFGSSLDQIGPIARDIKDIALSYDVVSGYDKHDSTSANFNHPHYLKLLKTDKKFTIGLPKEFIAEGLDTGVQNIMENAINVLTGNGHTLVDISLPMADRLIAMYYIIASAEASSNLARFDGVKYGLRIGDDEALLDMYGDTRNAGFGQEVKRRIILGTYVLSSGYYDAYYKKASQVRELLRRDFEKAFEQVDLIISPTAPTAAFKMGEKIDDPLQMYLSDIYTVSANLTGIPAISVPFGNLPDGRPVGVQFMASKFNELTLLQIAQILKLLSD